MVWVLNTFMRMMKEQLNDTGDGNKKNKLIMVAKESMRQKIYITHYIV